MGGWVGGKREGGLVNREGGWVGGFIAWEGGMVGDRVFVLIKDVDVY